MNIGIHCDILRNEHTGVEYYTQNLIQHLPSKPVLIHSEKFHHHLFKQYKTISFFSGPRFPGSRSVYNLFNRTPQNIDIIHYPTVSNPYFGNSKSKIVVTIHDITPLLMPEFHNWKRNVFFRLFLRSWLTKSTKIIVDSHNTKSDLLQRFNIPSSKINVVHLGVGSNFKPIKNHQVIQKYHLPEHYILFVGTIEPRKNISRLITAYTQLNPQEKLVIVGRRGWKNEKIIAAIKNNPNIQIVNDVEEQDLPAVYSHARLFVYPSLYEGFGLPVLEAMACGCPVITSNISSLPEVAGNATILVNPYNIIEITTSMNRVLKDKKLQEHLKRQGLKQAKKFSWKKCAKETFKIYQETYNEHTTSR